MFANSPGLDRYAQTYDNFVAEIITDLQTQMSATGKGGLKNVDALITCAIKNRLTGKTNEFGVAMRSLRCGGLDNSFENSVIDFSGLACQRISRAFELGQRARKTVLCSGIAPEIGIRAAAQLVGKYYFAEKRMSANSESGQRLLLKKESRAFVMGVMGVDSEVFGRQREWLNDKNVIQMMDEEFQHLIPSGQMTLSPENTTFPSPEEFAGLDD